VGREALSPTTPLKPTDHQRVSERMGTQKSNISRLEHGRSNPSWKILTRYAHACGYELKLTTLERSVYSRYL
jgi:Helix-turn-helix.